MPPFPTRGFFWGAGLVALGVLLVAALFSARMEVPLRLLALAPSLLVLLVGSAVAVFSLAAFRWQRRARLRGTRSQGFVEAVETTRAGFRVRARWRNALGREFHFDSAATRERPAVAEGERVTVWVDEADPARYHYVELGTPSETERARRP